MYRLIKSLGLTAAILALGSAFVVAQTPPAPPAAGAPTNAVGPRIQFETPVYDFGRVRSGEVVKHNFVFTNTGDALLVIKSVQPGCGCTTVGEWTKEVEPGKTGSVAIQFNSASFNGMIIKQPSVTCNVTNQPVVILQLKGTVYRPFDVMPQLAVLNVPPDSELASTVVTITNNTEEPLLLSEPECNNRVFAAQLKTNVLGKGYQLTISTVPPLPMGNPQGQITLRTGWTNPPAFIVTALANVQPAVRVTPSYITLAPGPLGSAVTNSISIVNQGTNDLRLSEPAVTMPGVTAEFREMQPGKLYTALVAFPQGFQMPPGQQVLFSFKTSHPKFPVVRVPVMQMPRPAPPPVPAAIPLKPTPPPTAGLPSIEPPMTAGH